MSSTALLIMDVQPSIVANFPADDAYFTRLNTLADAARAAGVPVIYVVVSFRPGHPEISARNAAFGQVKANGSFVDEGVHPAVAPRAGEPVVAKKRVSAFTGSDLEVILRAGGITRLVLTGIATSGVVLSTLRQAADLDYEVTVVSDACLDRDDEVHRVLVEKVFPRQAKVALTAEVAAGWAK